LTVARNASTLVVVTPLNAIRGSVCCMGCPQRGQPPSNSSMTGSTESGCAVTRKASTAVVDQAGSTLSVYLSCLVNLILRFMESPLRGFAAPEPARAGQ
jgi:hypothetical protein